MCVTTTHYDTHVSTECATGGSGQCDGYCYEHGEVECTCSCHSDWEGNLPTTVEGMQAWHDQANNVVARTQHGYHSALAIAEDYRRDTGGVWDGVRGADFVVRENDREHYIVAMFS